MLTCAVAGVAATSARAADIAYSVTPADANFSGINWALGQDPTAAPTQAAGNTDNLFFGGTPTLTTLNNDLTGAVFAGLTFNADAAAFTITGNAFTLGGNLVNSSTATQTITPAITLDAVRTLDAAFTSAAAFNPGTVVLSGNLGGAGGLIKIGAGTATLRGANNYTGGTTVNVGSLLAQRTTQVALGTGAVTVANGANVTIVDHAGGGQLAYANAFNLAGTGINGGGALSFLNSGGFAVSGPVSISGGTTIATDPVTQSTTSLINFSTAAIISGSGGLNLVSQGSSAAGTPQFRLDAANTYTGNTLLTSSGVNTTPFTVTLQGTSANRLPTATNLIFGGTPAGASGTFDKSVTLALNNTAQTVAGLSTANTPAAGQAYRIVGVNANTAVFSVANATANTYNGSFGGTGTNNNNIQLNKTGAGLLTLGGDSAYTGAGATLANGKVAGYGTVIGVVTTAGAATADTTTGSVRATSNNAFGGAGILLASTSTAPISGVQLSGGISLPAANTLSITTGRSVSLASASASPILRNIDGDNTFAGAVNIITGGGGAYIQSDANTLTLSGNLGSGTAAAIYGFSGAGNITVTGNITTTTAGQIAKLGGGLLTLSGTNTYTGNTVIGNTVADGAAIRVTSNNALGSGTGTVVINAGNGSGLTPALQLAGGITVANPIAATLRNIANSSAEILNVSGNNTLTGNIVSAAPSGGNGYNIQSDSGVLSLNGNLTYGNGSSYSFLGAGDITVNGNLATATAGGLKKAGAGTLTLKGTNAYAGSAAISAGTVLTGSTSALGTSAVALTGTGVLSVGDGTVNTVGGLTGFSAISTTTFDINSLPTANSAASLVQLTAGLISVAGAKIDLSGLFDSLVLPAGTTTYTLIDGVAGANSITNASFLNANPAYTYAFNVVGDDGVLSVTAGAVPEPTTLVAVGLGGLLALRRRRTA